MACQVWRNLTSTSLSLLTSLFSLFRMDNCLYFVAGFGPLDGRLKIRFITGLWWASKAVKIKFKSQANCLESKKVELFSHLRITKFIIFIIRITIYPNVQYKKNHPSALSTWKWSSFTPWRSGIQKPFRRMTVNTLGSPAFLMWHKIWWDYSLTLPLSHWAIL